MKKEENYSKSSSTIFKNTDAFFLELTFALIVIGLIFAFTGSSYESYRLTQNFWMLGLKQFIALISGLILFFLFSNLHYKFWYEKTWHIAWFVLFIMALTVFTPVGKVSGGSQRWIDLGFFQFQPAEIAKFSVLLLTCRFLAKYKWNEIKKYYYLLFSLAIILIILKQPDLGSSAILVLLTIELFFIFGFPVWLLLIGSMCSVYLVYLKILSTPYQLDRLKYWLYPFLDPKGKGYNLIQAKYAFGFGSLPGAGLGNSVQKQGFLPVPHADFIFAIMAEEIGLIGITAILILYLTWTLRGIYLINKVENKYGRILGLGIILLISTQALINILVASGLLPVTGVTLPFFSCGGTSLIVTLAMCGVLFSVIASRTK